MILKNSYGDMTLDLDASPTQDSMTDIITSFTRNDDNGEEFRELAVASKAFEDPTNGEFLKSCEAWLAGYRRVRPLSM